MEDYVGKICPVCREEIKPGEQVIVCSSCDIPHHKNCWESNKGCSTFGCIQQGSFKPELRDNTKQQINLQSEINFKTPQKVYNTRQNRSRVLSILSILLFLVSGIMLYEGYDKMTNYLNSDFVQVNAYVGGDAYNYIINGTYATAFFVLASGAFIAGVICIAINEIIVKIPQIDRIE